MEFGNWQVDEKGIHWNGDKLNRFEIPPDSLNRVSGQDGSAFYDWIILATNEDWLTQNDLYDLNFAFVYAIAQFKLDFNYEIFDATLADQYEQFDEEDEEYD
jgi:hypothetical protein